MDYDQYYIQEFKRFISLHTSSVNTIKNYISDLRLFFSFINQKGTSPLSPNSLPIYISSDFVNQYESYLSLTNPPATTKRRISSLKKFVDYCQSVGITPVVTVPTAQHFAPQSLPTTATPLPQNYFSPDQAGPSQYPPNQYQPIPPPQPQPTPSTPIQNLSPYPYPDYHPTTPFIPPVPPIQQPAPTPSPSSINFFQQTPPPPPPQQQPTPVQTPHFNQPTQPDHSQQNYYTPNPLPAPPPAPVFPNHYDEPEVNHPTYTTPHPVPPPIPDHNPDKPSHHTNDQQLVHSLESFLQDSNDFDQPAAHPESESHYQNRKSPEPQIWTYVIVSLISFVICLSITLFVTLILMK